MNSLRLCNSFRSINQPIYKLSCRYSIDSRPAQERRFMDVIVDEDVKDGLKDKPNQFADIEDRVNKSKEKLKWRTPVAENLGMVSSMFRMFAPERTSSYYTQILTFKKKLSLSTLQQDVRQQILEHEIYSQRYIMERHRVLGNDLAAAHFILFRGGEVRFTTSREWIKKDELDNVDIPTIFDRSYIISGLICDKMSLHYEGLENIRRLNYLKYLSLRDIKYFDDWCLDRIAGNAYPRLEVLDLTGTKITANGLTAIPKILSLKYLIIDNITRSTEFELSLLLLQECMPQLSILDANDEVAKTIKNEYEDRTVKFLQL